MEISHKILSIPPYISTSWKNVTALKTESKDNLLELSIILQDGTSISIPGLEHALIQVIFSFHAKYLESETVPFYPPSSLSFRGEPQGLSLPSLDIKLLSKLDALSQHDPDNKNAPQLPEGLLNQFSHMMKSMPLELLQNLPLPEADCHCPYCQITGVIFNLTPKQEEFSLEEEVSDAELNFTSWIIEPLENKVYKVTHPDELEKSYLVSLTPPLECSCGSNRCEHILAILHS